MPTYLKEVEVVPEVAKFQSALIVLCRFCPAASLAIRNDKPYIEFFRRLLKTEPYEELIDKMQSRLKKEGLKTGVFKGNLLNYLICMWTSGQRKKLINKDSIFYVLKAVYSYLSFVFTFFVINFWNFKNLFCVY